MFLRFRRFLPLAFPLAPLVAGPLLLVLSGACNGQQATVLTSDAIVDARGGETATCTADAQCNENPTISSLRGACQNGTCVCNPGITVTPSGKCGDPVVGPDASTTTTPNDCVAKGGVCAADPVTPPPNYRPAGPGEGTCDGNEKCFVPVSFSSAPVCFNDQGCNGDPSVSTLWGSCFLGVCMCKPGYTVQPNGKCNTPPPPACTTQKGTCRQEPAQCLADELASEPETAMSCGDFIEATCCNKKATCNGPAREAAGAGWVPVDFTCCAPNDAEHAPICVNGWQTCPKGDLPVARPAGCG